MAVEVVLLTPVLLAFVMLVVAGGRYVAAQGKADSVARDAARAYSLHYGQRPNQAATQVIAESFKAGRGCTHSITPLGDAVRVHLTCEVSYAGLGLIGLPGSVTVDGQSVSPIDIYRSK